MLVPKMLTRFVGFISLRVVPFALTLAVDAAKSDCHYHRMEFDWLQWRANTLPYVSKCSFIFAL